MGSSGRGGALVGGIACIKGGQRHLGSSSLLCCLGRVVQHRVEPFAKMLSFLRALDDLVTLLPRHLLGAAHASLDRIIDGLLAGCVARLPVLCDRIDRTGRIPGIAGHRSGE